MTERVIPITDARRTKHARAQAARPAHLGHRPLQLPLHLLHAARRVRPRLRVSPEERFAELRGDRAAGARFQRPRGRENPPDRRRASTAQEPRAPDRDARRHSGDRSHAHHQWLGAREKSARPEGGGPHPRHGQPRLAGRDGIPQDERRRLSRLRSAERYRCGRRGGARADQDQHGGEARRERGFRHPDGALFQGQRPHRALHRVHGRRRDQRLAHGRRSALGRDRPHDRREDAHRNGRAELHRRSRRALALPGRVGGDRGDLLGDAGLLPHLHSRSALHGGHALYLPFRHGGLRPARTAAPRLFRRGDLGRDRAHLAGACRPLFRAPHRGDGQAAQDRDVLHRRMTSARPELTHASKPLTFEVEAINERGEAVPTPIAGEHPLTLYVDKREIVTLMTLGQAPEALAIGYLRNQRLVRSIDEIAAVQVDWETASVAITTRKPLKGLDEKMKKRTVTTGCGQGTVFGDLMEEIDSIKLRDDVTLTDADLFVLLEKVRKHETIYKQAGAVHGCALATTSGEILMFVEDVGRHNAVDAIAGFMWLDGIDGSDKVFYTTGRLTSEMVIKCAQMRIPFLVSRSGLTQMGHAIAQKTGITMLGRASGRHYLAFTGKERLVRSLPRPTALA